MTLVQIASVLLSLIAIACSVVALVRLARLQAAMVGVADAMIEEHRKIETGR